MHQGLFVTANCLSSSKGSFMVLLWQAIFYGSECWALEGQLKKTSGSNRNE